jgi:MFS family permease
MTYLILMIPNTTTGLIIGRFNAARVLRLVVTILLVASALIFYSLNQSWATGFLLIVALLGVANGGCCTAGLKIVIQDTTLEERAGTIGAIYLSAYVGSGIPNLIIGQLGKTTSMDTLGIGYTFWSFLAFAIVHGMLFWIRQTASDTEKKAVL